MTQYKAAFYVHIQPKDDWQKDPFLKWPKSLCCASRTGSSFSNIRISTVLGYCFFGTLCRTRELQLFPALILFIKNEQKTKKSVERKRARIFNVQLASLDGLSLFSAILQIMVASFMQCYNKYHESIPKQEYEKEHSSKDWWGGRAWEVSELNLTKFVRATMKNKAGVGHQGFGHMSVNLQFWSKMRHYSTYGLRRLLVFYRGLDVSSMNTFQKPRKGIYVKFQHKVFLTIGQ